MKKSSTRLFLTPDLVARVEPSRAEPGAGPDSTDHIDVEHRAIAEQLFSICAILPVLGIRIRAADWPELDTIQDQQPAIS